MPSLLSPCIRSFTPPSSAFNLSHTETTIMSYDATSVSSPSPLSSSIIDDTSRPSSTQPEAGWGSPSPAPDSFPPISLATIPTPIHSVTIPLYAHTLRNDFPDSQDIKKLSNYLHSPAFALSIDSFLDIGSPLYTLRCAYLKNSHLRLMSMYQHFSIPSADRSLPSYPGSIPGDRRILGNGYVPAWHA